VKIAGKKERKSRKIVRKFSACRTGKQEIKDILRQQGSERLLYLEQNMREKGKRKERNYGKN
jgi:hypothetical protein